MEADEHHKLLLPDGEKKDGGDLRSYAIPLPLAGRGDYPAISAARTFKQPAAAR